MGKKNCVKGLGSSLVVDSLHVFDLAKKGMGHTKFDFLFVCFV